MFDDRRSGSPEGPRTVGQLHWYWGYDADDSKSAMTKSRWNDYFWRPKRLACRLQGWGPKISVRVLTSPWISEFHDFHVTFDWSLKPFSCFFNHHHRWFSVSPESFHRYPGSCCHSLKPLRNLKMRKESPHFMWLPHGAILSLWNTSYRRRRQVLGGRSLAIGQWCFGHLKTTGLSSHCLQFKARRIKMDTSDWFMDVI